MSTTGKEHKLLIRIAGTIDKSFNKSLTSAQTGLRGFAKSVSAIDSDFTKLDKGFNKIMSAGKTCFKAIASAASVAATAIGAATAASISVGSEFESAFAGVKKTTDATAEEYEQLRQSIISMTREIPASASEIAGVMEIAGQLGIAKEALSDFTEVMINMGVSTNLSADEAATNLAKFANIMQMDNYGEDGISNYERLGSTVVDLGNKFATTESEVVAIATQLAATGQLAGMSEADIMGISAAMSSVGLTAEAGASSMSRLFMQMQQAVSEGGAELDQYAEVAGTTSEEFAALFRSDAAGAVTDFIHGLNLAGEDSYGILEDLDLSTIRLRKAFLSLAGADGIMTEALDIANEAWTENMALAVEAGKRYETAESKVQFMKNAFTELGIVAYDDLREPFVDVVEGITDSVYDLTEYVGSADGVSKWIKNIEKTLPTLKRKFNTYAEPVFGAIKSAGGWVIDNGDKIISVISGIAAGLAAYKLASTGVHALDSILSLTKLNPVTLGILGVVSAIGLLTAAYTEYKQYEQGLIDDNLAAHFGNIALSMEEIQTVAEYIIGSDSLSGVKKALEAFDDLEPIESSIEAAVEELDKLNWKVSIGMELTEDEQSTYQTTIDEYVQAANAYAEQSQYAVSLSIKLGLGDNDIVDENGYTISDKVNAFYASQTAEMEALGVKLSDAVNEAFADNILDPEELDEIANIQAKMAELQAELATSEFDARLTTIGMKYGGLSELDPETFKNLQAELATQVDAANEAYADNYAKSRAALDAAFRGGYMDYQAYLDGISGLEQTYLQSIGETSANSINTQLETIMSTYSEELDPAISAYMDNIQQILQDYTEVGEGWWTESPALYFESMISEIMDAGTLDKTTRGAISELLEQMAPTVEQMEGIKQQCEEAGQEVPQAIIDGLTQFDMLNALANSDYDSIGEIIGQQMVEGGTFDGFYEKIFSQLDTETQIPQGVANGVSTAAAQAAAESVTAAGEAAIPPAVDGAYTMADSNIDSTFEAGFDTTTSLSLTLIPNLTNYSAIQNFVDNKISGFNANIQVGQRAKGGLATSPELTWFAEEGPEMAIPIDGSQNAINLWEQTGRLLGMDSVLDGVVLDGGTSSTVQYSPTLQFYGEAPSKADLTDALRISQDEFENLMERYLKTQGRVSFA